MKKQLAFGSLLLMTSHLVAPAALAQDAGSGGVQTQTVDPTAGQDPQDQEYPQEELEISTPGADVEGDTIIVSGRIPSVIRSTPQVVSVLSSADIARTGEGDIAGALTRVTGLSVVGNGFVYVRGLGDRYSLSMLNGSPLPSPEPLKRVVPLDIFPTNIVSSALVQKSYSVNYPGEFGGGVINLTTRSVPRDSFLQLGASVGFDTESTSELGYVYDGGSIDSLGYDDGERTVPGFIKQANGATITDSTLLTRLSNAPTTLLQTQYHLPANWSGELSFGTSADFGNNSVGIIGAAGINNSFRTRASLQQTANSPTGTVTRDFDTVLTDNRILVNGLLGIGADIGEHRFRVTQLYIHDTLKQGRLSAGDSANLDNFAGPDQIEQNTNWFERQLLNTQAIAEFDFGNFDLDFRGNYANTKRKAPYERSFLYEYNATAADYVNALGGTSNSGANIAFSDLNENLWAGSADASYKFDTLDPVTVSAGYAYSDTDRDSTRFDYRFVAPGGLPLALAQQRPDALLSDYSIQLNNIFLQSNLPNGTASFYNAKLRVHAGYFQLSSEALDGTLSSTVGVRYEDGTESITTTQKFEINNDYWLPAATITWTFQPDWQLRLHASKTIARPQFRELAPQIYQDYDSDRLFRGNPLLQDSELYNGEARLEWYFDRDQRVSVAGFYKRIDNPIETVSSFFGDADGAPQVGFSNAPSANLYGAEVELQKYVPLDWLGGDAFATRRLVLIGNYTYSHSEIEAGNELVANPTFGNAPLQASQLFDDGAPMTGQSDHLVNVQVGIEDTESLSQLTFLFNYASERVTARGPIASGVRLPDFIERPGIRFDIVARQGFELAGADFELKFEARNLTKTDYREFQDFGDNGIVYINHYDLGRVFSLGVSTTF